MLNRIFVVDSVTLTSTGTAVSTYTPWDQTTRKLPTQVVVKATGQGAYVRLSNDASAATNADVLVQGGDHVVLSVQGRRWVSVLSDGASSTVNVGALSTGVSGSAASLDLAFVDAGVLDPRVTFTRASTATYFDSAGVLQSAAINAPRFDYNPATLAARGFFVEEARTNSIRNNTMQGAVAPFTFPTNWQNVIVAGLTATVVGTGAQNGITYLDVRVNGTPSISTFYNLVPDILVAGASGQTWTGSFWASLIAGSLSNTNANIEIRESDAAQGFLTNTLTALPITSVLTRYSQARTLTNASTAFVSVRFVWQVTSGLPVDFTLRIGLPQLEQGAFATSVIPTTTTALTRSADVASVNTLSPWYSQTAGTIVCQFRKDVGTTGRLIVVDNGSGALTTNGINLDLTSATQARTEGFAGGAPQWDLRQTIALGSTQTTAVAYSTNDIGFSANGASPTTDNVATIASTGISVMALANWQGGLQLNGWLRRVVFYPRRLSNAELQAITA